MTKNRPLLAILLGLGSICAPAFSAPPVRISLIGPDGLAPSWQAHRLAFGTARLTVLDELGEPTRVRPDGTWLYEGTSAALPGRKIVARSVLVITFTRDRVTGMALENEAGRVVARASEAPAPDRPLVALHDPAPGSAKPTD